MSTWYTNPYLPWEWPSDVSHSFLSSFESSVEYVIHLFIVAFLSLMASIESLVIGALGIFFSDLLSLVTPLGPFALPVTVFVVIMLFGGVAVSISLLKDVPLVGAAL